MTQALKHQIKAFLTRPLESFTKHFAQTQKYRIPGENQIPQQ